MKLNLVILLFYTRNKIKIKLGSKLDTKQENLPSSRPIESRPIEVEMLPVSHHVPTTNLFERNVIS